MLNRISTLALLGLFTFAAACGDDGDTSKSNNTATTNNSTNNTTNNSTNNSTNNTTNNTTNNDTNNPTNNAVTQCTAVGQTCVAGDATNAGFVCGDDGLGAKCLRACTPPADGEAYPCTSGQLCSTLEQGGATACIPSQCAGFQDAAACDKYNYPTGGSCFGTENDNFICIPAGEKTLGVACETVDDCASGLLCFDGECKTVCSSDAGCTAADERCVGDTDPDFLNAGAGVCELGCDSYSTGQCAAGTGCFPFTATDGICVPDNGTGAPGAACTAATFDMAGNLLTPASGCLGGLACVNFGEGVATCWLRVTEQRLRRPRWTPPAQPPTELSSASTSLIRAKNHQIQASVWTSARSLITALIVARLMASTVRRSAASDMFVCQVETLQ